MGIGATSLSSKDIGDGNSHRVGPYTEDIMHIAKAAWDEAGGEAGTGMSLTKFIYSQTPDYWLSMDTGDAAVTSDAAVAGDIVDAVTGDIVDSDA